MSIACLRLFALTSALAGIVATTESAHAAEVTIYRCTDAKGHLTLRDTPCRPGEKQQTRSMLRPQDPPARPVPKAESPPSGATAATSTAAPRTIVLTPPRPLYECISPNGDRYTSDTAEGSPRWVPLWTLGYPVWPRHDRHVDSGIHARIGGRFDHARFDVRFGTPRHHHPPAAVVPTYPAGTWVRDECYALPQQEICDRLRDRRWELDRRYNSAMQSERAQITLEERGIDARLSNDCGGS